MAVGGEQGDQRQERTGENSGPALTVQSVHRSQIGHRCWVRDALLILRLPAGGWHP
jgi:hypothetical protein